MTSVSSLPQQRLDPSRGRQMIAPILSRKGTYESGAFPERKAHDARPREQSARALCPNAQIVCVIWCQKTLTRIDTPPKRFSIDIITHTSETKSPEDKKRMTSTSVFHRRPFMPADAHLFTSYASTCQCQVHCVFLFMLQRPVTLNAFP